VTAKSNTDSGVYPSPNDIKAHRADARDARGLGEQARRQARMLAEQGYIALATDMYGGGARFETAPEASARLRALHQTPERRRGLVLAGYEA
jgi:dienelactone hydrolase